MLLGDIPMGERLSPEALAREIGISRTPMREAMAQLGAEGLLEQVPHCGTFVKKFTRQEIWELLELRELMEGYVAARAAARMGPEQLKELQVLCDRMLHLCHRLPDEKRRDFTPEEREQFSFADAHFHLMLVRASGNEQVEKLVENYGLITRLCYLDWVFPQSIQFKINCWTWGAHARILRALKNQDCEAARHWMSDHIRRSESTIMKYFDAQEELAVTPINGRVLSVRDLSAYGHEEPR
jgi:DNA-binding GntR family transcriptional regulator